MPPILRPPQAVWCRIDAPDYRPIDWQLDFRSGYRWDSQRHFTQLRDPDRIGADVKVPWELGRLQHLPQLALCAVLAQAEVRGFAPPADYLQELRCQVLDFLALNPPRFGINWMCPMDVGIRVANMVLAFDLVIGSELDSDGAIIDQPLIDMVVRSVREHANHVADHLEWSDHGRSNHYPCKFARLAVGRKSSSVGSSGDAMFAFAAAELLPKATCSSARTAAIMKVRPITMAFLRNCCCSASRC